MSENPQTSGESVQENPSTSESALPPPSPRPAAPREVGAMVPASGRTVRNARARGRVIE